METASRTSGQRRNFNFHAIELAGQLGGRAGHEAFPRDPAKGQPSQRAFAKMG